MDSVFETTKQGHSQNVEQHDMQEEYNINPVVLHWPGRIIFILSSLFLIFALIIVVRRRKDPKFLYRSPNLVIVAFTAALV